MFRRLPQNGSHSHFAALGVGRADAIRPVGETYISVGAEVHDHFGSSCKTVDVPRFMVLRIGNEPHFAETKRRHNLDYNPSGLG